MEIPITFFGVGMDVFWNYIIKKNLPITKIQKE